MEITEEIKKIAEEKLMDPAHFVIDVIVSQRGTQKVLIVVDGDNGVTIDDCAEISKRVSTVLDTATFLKDSYLLEVSTPGLDQPLRLMRQYVKNIGRKLRVRTKDNLSVIEGKLVSVSPESITLEQETGMGKKKENKLIDIQFSEIDKSFVLISFK